MSAEIWQCCVILLVALITGDPVCAQSHDDRPVWAPVARIHRTVLAEVSGVVASRKYPGVFWLHGDSGTDPLIVAIDEEGEVLASVKVSGAPNTDWEDITTDDAGHLYIGDIGNSRGMFPARYIYTIDEPDPHNPPSSPVKVISRRRFKYPGEKRFDFESLFWHAGALYVIPRNVGQTTIFRVDPVGDEKANLVEVAAFQGYSATGADVSSDGTHLLVCSPHATVVYPLTEGDSFLDAGAAKRVTYPSEGAVEACCFAGNDAIITNESGAIYKVSAKQIEQCTRFANP